MQTKPAQLVELSENGSKIKDEQRQNEILARRVREEGELCKCENFGVNGNAKSGFYGRVYRGY